MVIKKQIKVGLDMGIRIPRMTIGVMGAAGGDLRQEIREKVFRLGAAIGQRRHVLLTGACPGLPQEAVDGANTEGGLVVGISPAHSLEEHVTRYHSPTAGYGTMIYTGSGLMGREIENILSCDAVIFAGGRSGTLGEFAIAYEEGKLIGILEGSGGIADNLNEIIGMINKKTDAIVRSHSDPSALLGELEAVFIEKVLPNRMKFLQGSNPKGLLDP